MLKLLTPSKIALIIIEITLIIIEILQDIDTFKAPGLTDHMFVFIFL